MDVNIAESTPVALIQYGSSSQFVFSLSFVMAGPTFISSIFTLFFIRNLVSEKASLSVCTIIIQAVVHLGVQKELSMLTCLQINNGLHFEKVPARLRVEEMNSKSLQAKVTVVMISSQV